METVAVQYLGGSAEVFIVAAGVTALRGEDGEPGPPVDVPAEVAGAEPFWRPLAPGDDPAWLETRTVPTGEVDDDGNPVERVEVRDLGSGLLAQVGTWRRAPAPAGEGD